MCFCVCEWTFEYARSVAEIAPATMSMYFDKRAAMPELLFVCTCLLVSSCVCDCACVFVCDHALCVCIYLLVCPCVCTCVYVFNLRN